MRKSLKYRVPDRFNEFVMGIHRFNEFVMGIQNRLKAGAREYGDTTYKKSGIDLAAEIEEELLDVCGWSFFLWLKIRGMKEAMEKGATGPEGKSGG